jgi:hypothetical protein
MLREALRAQAVNACLATVVKDAQWQYVHVAGSLGHASPTTRVVKLDRAWVMRPMQPETNDAAKLGHPTHVLALGCGGHSVAFANSPKCFFDPKT